MLTDAASISRCRLRLPSSWWTRFYISALLPAGRGGEVERRGGVVGLLLRALGRPWWRERVARRNPFFCLLGSWPSRVRRLHPPPSCFPGTLAATGLLRAWWLLASSWELLGVSLRRFTAAASAVTSGLKGVGHRSLCFDRRSLCCCHGCGGSRRRPRRIWRWSSWTGSRFVSGSRVLSALLQSQLVIGIETVSGSFETPLRSKKKKIRRTDGISDERDRIIMACSDEHETTLSQVPWSYRRRPGGQWTRSNFFLSKATTGSTLMVKYFYRVAIWFHNYC
jgi:hypothetical protein